MTTELKAIDIGDSPELVRLVEEVRADREPRLLLRHGEALAVLTPVRAPKHQTGRTTGKADDEAFLASAGGWKNNVDVEQFLADNEASRDRSTRQPVDL